MIYTIDGRHICGTGLTRREDLAATDKHATTVGMTLHTAAVEVTTSLRTIRIRTLDHRIRQQGLIPVCDIPNTAVEVASQQQVVRGQFVIVTQNRHEVVRHKTVQRVAAVGEIIIIQTSVLGISLVIHCLGVCDEVVYRIDVVCVINIILLHKSGVLEETGLQPVSPLILHSCVIANTFLHRVNTARVGLVHVTLQRVVHVGQQHGLNEKADGAVLFQKVGKHVIG